MQTQVDTAGDTRRGQDITVVDEQAIRLDIDIRILRAQQPRRSPVRRRRSTGQQPGGGDREGAGADGQYPGAAVVCSMDNRRNRFRRRPIEGRVSGHDHGIGLVTVVRLISQPRRRGRYLRRRRTHHHVIVRVRAEDIDRDGLPATPVADAVLAVVRASEPESIVNHSIRSFLFAELLAGDRRLVTEPDYDRDLLFAATVLHDLGTGTGAPGKERFEVEGADLAAQILTDLALPAAAVDRVWEAIALHTSPGIAERRGLLAYLTAEGSKMDIGFHADLTAPHLPRIHAAYPRRQMVKTLTDAIVAHASRSENAAPIYSMGNLFVMERRVIGYTQLEILAAGHAPWGE